MEPRDWTLLALAAAEGRALSPARLQKSLFLLGQKFPAEALGGRFYEFVPYDYGPFSKQIYLDTASLVGDGYAQTIRGPRWYEHAATPEGIKRGLELRIEGSAEAVAYLAEVVNWALSLSFQELVRAIYRAFPDYKINSVFRD